MIENMGLEFILGKMDVNMKVIGTMVNNMEKEFIDSQQASNVVVNGMKGNGLPGLTNKIMIDYSVNH